MKLGFITHDVQKSFDQAIDAGAEAVSFPVKKPWGQTVSYVRDLNGLLVEICSEIES
jgi:lactoylglutathione lyase